MVLQCHFQGSLRIGVRLRSPHRDFRGVSVAEPHPAKNMALSSVDSLYLWTEPSPTEVLHIMGILTSTG
jgi:hypothetical protein